MFRLQTVISAIVTISLVMACAGCDKYNIVEPRFYSEDDVVEFGECGWDPYPKFAGASDKLLIVSTSLEASTDYSVDGCWYNRELYVTWVTPEPGQITLTILNSVGGVEIVMYDGYTEAAVHQMVWGIPWEDRDDGV